MSQTLQSQSIIIMCMWVLGLGLPDYERQGDTLRDITVRDAQLAIQRGDLPVLRKVLTQVIQAQATLSQYILLEPRADYDALIRAQILDLDTYKNRLENEIENKQPRTEPQTPVQPTPIDQVEIFPIEQEERLNTVLTQVLAQVLIITLVIVLCLVKTFKNNNLKKSSPELELSSTTEYIAPNDDKKVSYTSRANEDTSTKIMIKRLRSTLDETITHLEI